MIAEQSATANPNLKEKKVKDQKKLKNRVIINNRFSFY